MGSRFYDESQFVCHCCGQLPVDGIDPKLYELVDEIRDYFGIDININCAYRCPAHNEEVGGVPNSQHVTGQAVDLDASDIGVDLLADIAEQFGADGIGKYYDDCFVHCDVRSGKIGDSYRWEG